MIVRGAAVVFGAVGASRVRMGPGTSRFAGAVVPGHRSGKLLLWQTDRGLFFEAEVEHGDGGHDQIVGIARGTCAAAGMLYLEDIGGLGEVVDRTCVADVPSRTVGAGPGMVAWLPARDIGGRPPAVSVLWQISASAALESAAQPGVVPIDLRRCGRRCEW